MQGGSESQGESRQLQQHSQTSAGRGKRSRDQDQEEPSKAQEQEVGAQCPLPMSSQTSPVCLPASLMSPDGSRLAQDHGGEDEPQKSVRITSSCILGIAPPHKPRVGADYQAVVPQWTGPPTRRQQPPAEAEEEARACKGQQH